jgi:hypothetical protein
VFEAEQAGLLALVQNDVSVMVQSTQEPSLAQARSFAQLLLHLAQATPSQIGVGLEH